MQRIALFVLVLFIVWKVLAVLGKRNARSGAEDFSRFSVRSRDRRRRQQEQRDEERDLAPCAACGTNVPADRLIDVGRGGRVCSDECRARLSEGS